jgi:hypothetical protein
MRTFIISIVFLLVIQRTFAADCICSCCTSKSCNPEPVAYQNIWFCSSQTCTADRCIEWYPERCPPRDAPGATRSECGSGSERLLPSLFILTGITSIIFMIKKQI